ncbi:MAG: hypothetical protein RLY16_2205 [Bacteroidota bacterium]
MRNLVLKICGIFWLGSCTEMAVAQPVPADVQASAATVHLLQGLHRTTQKGCMFGHQDDLAYGVEWRYKEGRSDVKEVAGDYPAVYGWDLGGIENDNSDRNLDGVPFKKMRQFIREAYERGGVVTLSWHLNNPMLPGKNAWDTTHGTVASILPGAPYHEVYKAWLDKVADFVGSLKNKSGEPIPVLFRPFHEFTGTWFWWCQNTCTTEEFVTLWRFTIYYLEQVKQLHHLITVYNTSDNFNTAEEFLKRYPGDDVVDVLSFDSYHYGDSTQSAFFSQKLHRQLQLISNIATEKNKLTALAETGFEAVPYTKWWTDVLLPATVDLPVSYVLVWRNHGLANWNNKMHYYAPYKGQISAADFIDYYNSPRTLFEKDVAAEKLYK